MKRTGPWLLTRSGSRVHPRDVRSGDIDLVDMAAGLSRTCRFNGQISDQYMDSIYSVAQHSVLVLRIYDRITGRKDGRKWALMHDGPEYIVGDTISPIKNMFPELEEMEDSVAVSMRKQFRIPYDADIHSDVKRADMLAVAMEAEALTSTTADHWGGLTADVPIEEYFPDFEPWGPKRSREEFLKDYDEVFN